jgi:predicted esterase
MAASHIHILSALVFAVACCQLPVAVGATCTDTEGFADNVYGEGCSAFGGEYSKCDTSLLDYGYSAEDVADIVASCPASCGTCEGAETLPTTGEGGKDEAAGGKGDDGKEGGGKDEDWGGDKGGKPTEMDFPVLVEWDGGPRPKILCLHGGGQSGPSFDEFGLPALRASLPGYEFVFPSGGYTAGAGQHLWMPDPPSKTEPTTDPEIAASSVEILDDIVATHGPFYGILGYSQGSAMVPVYLSHAPPGSFQVAMLFCGYLPNTHQGLLSAVNAASPFGNIPALVYMGVNDGTITNAMTQEQAAKFTSPTIVVDSDGGHSVPSNAVMLEQITSFVVENSPNGPPSESSNSGFPTRSIDSGCMLVASFALLASVVPSV